MTFHSIQRPETASFYSEYDIVGRRFENGTLVNIQHLDWNLSLSFE